MAHKLIAVKWMSFNLPQISQWIEVVNFTLKLQIFYAIWSERLASDVVGPILSLSCRLYQLFLLFIIIIQCQKFTRCFTIYKEVRTEEIQYKKVLESLARAVQPNLSLAEKCPALLRVFLYYLGLSQHSLLGSRTGGVLFSYLSICLTKIGKKKITWLLCAQSPWLRCPFCPARQQFEVYSRYFCS